RLHVPRDRSKAGADGSRLYVAKTSSGLAPGPKHNKIGVIDSLPSRKVPGVGEAIQRRGPTLRYLSDNYRSEPHRDDIQQTHGSVGSLSAPPPGSTAGSARSLEG